jgi:hypothetical protein
MAMATENGKLPPKITIYRTGGIVTTVQGVAHNIYLPAGAIIHTVKHNGQGGKDWDAAPDLDEHTKQLKESDILRMGNA